MAEDQAADVRDGRAKRTGREVRDRRLWEVGAVLASIAFVLVLAWPASIQPWAWVWGSHGDGLGNLAEFTWYTQAIKQGVPLGVDPNLSIPFGENFGTLPHEPLYFLAQIAIGVLAGSVVALNVICLLALPAATWAMFRLVLWITRSGPASFVSGIGLGCSSYIIANSAGEPTLAQIWVFPATILATLRLLDGPSVRRIIVAAAVVTAAAMVNFYYVLFITLALLALGGTWLVYRTYERRSFPARSLLSGLGAGALAVIATVGIYELAVGHLAQRAALVHRTAVTLASLAATPVDFLLPPRLNPWLGAWRQQVFDARLVQHPGIYTDFSELSTAAPILVLALIGAAILIFPRMLPLPDWFARTHVVAIVAVGLIGAWLLVPPFGRRYGLTFLSLEWDIQSVAPQYGSFYRAGILVVLAACVVAGLALAALAIRYPRAVVWIAIISAAAIFVEDAVVTSDRVLAVEPLPAYSWLQQHPGTYAVADYPLLPPGSGANEYTALFYQRFYGHPMLNGSMGGTDAESMREQLRNPNGPGVAAALATLGIRYVIWQPAVIRQFAPLNPAYAETLLTFEPRSPGYEQVAAFQDGSGVFAVVAASVPSFAFYASGFGSTVDDGSAPWVRHTLSSSGRIDVFVPPGSSTTATLQFDCWSSDSGATLQAQGSATGIGSGSAAPVTLSARAAPGITEIQIAFAPASSAEQGRIWCSPISAS